MFQLSLSTLLTSPTTPGAGLIPSLSGDFSAALAGAAEASAAPTLPDAAPLTPRQGDADTGKSLPIPATEGVTNDPALAWLDNNAALVAAGGAWSAPTAQRDAPSPEAPLRQPAGTAPAVIRNSAAPVSAAKDAIRAIAIPVPAASAASPRMAAPASSIGRPPSPSDAAATQFAPTMADAAQPAFPAATPIVSAATAPASPVETDDASQPVAPAPISPRPAAADRIAITIETPSVAASPIVLESAPAPTKGGHSKKDVAVDIDGRHRTRKHAGDAPQPAASIDAVAILPGTPPAADPIPPVTGATAETPSSTATRVSAPTPMPPPGPDSTSPAPSSVAANPVAEPRLPTLDNPDAQVMAAKSGKPKAEASTPAFAFAPPADHARTPLSGDTPIRAGANGARIASAADSPAIAMPIASPDNGNSSVVPAAPANTATVSPESGRAAALSPVSTAPMIADHPNTTQRPQQNAMRGAQADAGPARPINAPSAPQPTSPAAAAAPVAPVPADAAPALVMASAPTPLAAASDPAAAAPQPVARLAADHVVKADAPASPAAAPAPQPVRPAPVPQAPQPAAIVLGVAFGGIVPGPRPLGGDRPSPREQALQALTALAGAAPAAPIAATAQSQHGTLDMRRDDWPQTMIDRIEALRDAADATSTRITLAPDALGKVDLSIRHDGSTVHVHFAAEAAQTRAILADAQPRLAELAQQRGFRLGQATVDAGAGGGGQRQQPQSSAAPPPQRPASAFTTTTAEAAADSTRLA